MWLEAVLFLSILAFGSTQKCYTRPLCEGDSFIANSARECCSDTDEGVSFSEDGTSCTIPQCIVTVEFESAVYTSSEDAGSVTVCTVIRGESAGEEIKIRLFTEEQTAKASRDFTHLEFSSVITERMCMSISIIDNYLPGSNVHFSVRATSSSHRIPPATTTVIIMDDEIPNGCTYEVVNASLSEEETRYEVVVEIAEALGSVLGGIGSSGSSPLGSIVGDGVLAPNETSDETPLIIVFTALAEAFKVKTTDEGFNNFMEAITQITEAKEAACEGEHGVSEADIPSLGKEYRSLWGDIQGNIDRIRDIFGKMLCLSERSHEARRRKRQDPLCFCPDVGDIISVCEFFACLPGDDIMPIFGIENVLVLVGSVFKVPCLAFAVDTTGSMADEIEAAQEVILNFLRSEEHGLGCYVLQPFNDLRYGIFHNESIPNATVATTYNGNQSIIELKQLKNVTDNLIAYDGGDHPERQFKALMAILELIDSDRLLVMIRGSEIVLLTDASSHDADLEDDIITKARSMNVCISFYLSYTEFEPYARIAAQTGGTVVYSIDRHAFRAFDDEHDYGQCASFYDLPTLLPPTSDPPISGRRKQRSVVTPSFNTEQRCHYFTTSSFATSLTARVFTGEEVIVTTPEEVRVIGNIRGEELYHAVNPPAGQWSICVETGTLTISLDITNSIHSILKFHKSDEGSFSLRSSPPPPACTEDRVSIETSQIANIRSPSLQLVDNESGEVLTTAPLLRCANRLLGNVSFPQATVSYRIVGSDANGWMFNSTLSPKTITFTEENGTKFSVEADGEGSMEIESGQAITIPLRVQNFLPTDVHYSFTAEPVTGFRQAFRPTSLVVAPRGNDSVTWFILPLSSTEPGSTITFTATVTDGCVVHSASKTVSFIAPVTTPQPVTNECGCMHGTCIIRIIQGRRILRCVCPEGYSGSRCEDAS
jgi:hypothetical protein